MAEPRAVQTLRACEVCGAPYYTNGKCFHAADCPEVEKQFLPLGLPPQNQIEHVPTTYTVGKVGFTACWDKVVIVEDSFTSGYECSVCHGAGKLTCDICKGSGTHPLNKDMRCKSCAGTGKSECDACKGKGATIIIPENAQRRPTTGQIVSAGEKCQRFEEGDSVLFSNFAGHAVKLNHENREIVLRFLHETEIICEMSGLLELRSHKDFVEMTTV